jgi:hypothetical protein
LGRLSKGSFDLAKLEPALSRHPSGRISNHARVFAPVNPEPHFGNNKFTNFMKPTPHVSQNRNSGFPLTDYNYQPTLDASYVATKEKRVAHRRDGLWRLGTEFHGAEAVYGDPVDFLVFTLMGLACTWPVFSVGMAIVHVFLG